MRNVRGTGALLAVVASLLSCARGAPNADAAGATPHGARYDVSVGTDLERVRKATAAFRDIAAAHAAGYPVATPPCLSNPMVGGMGHHYVARKYVDDSLDVEHPEILLYAPTADGKPKLVAVEYIIPYRIRPRDSQPPRIFGQALKRSDELSLWYLHVWAWEENAAGLFADWNTAVKC